MLTDPVVNGVHVAESLGRTGRFHVTAVYEQVVRGGWVRHEIWTTTGDPTAIDGPRRVFSTVNPWRASVCQRAKERGHLVEGRWIETPYGPELIEVQEVQ